MRRRGASWEVLGNGPDAGSKPSGQIGNARVQSASARAMRECSLPRPGRCSLIAQPHLPRNSPAVRSATSKWSTLPALQQEEEGQPGALHVYSTGARVNSSSKKPAQGSLPANGHTCQRRPAHNNALATPPPHLALVSSASARCMAWCTVAASVEERSISSLPWRAMSGGTPAGYGQGREEAR